MAMMKSANSACDEKYLSPLITHSPPSLCALHLHGALGVSNEMGLASMLIGGEIMGLADGPTEVHKVTIAKQVLKEHEAYEGLWPREFLPYKVEEAKKKFAEFIEHDVANN
jgi:acyl-CoA dehydrogenase